MDEIWSWSAAAIGRAVGSGEVPACEVLDAHLARIDEVDPLLNAVTVRFAEARAEAERIDGRVRSGSPVGPLAGVPSGPDPGRERHRQPVVRRDPQSVGRDPHAGRHERGRRGRDRVRDGRDRARQRLRRLGAATRDVLRCRGAEAGLRARPHRPPDRRRRPDAGRAAVPVDGPIARTVADLTLAFEALAGADPADPRAVPAPAPRTELPRRVAVCADPAGLGVHPQVRAEVAKAADALAAAGYEVEEAEPPRLADVLTSYGTLVTAEFGLRWQRIRALLTEESAQHMELSMARQPPADLAGYLQATATRFGAMRDWDTFAERYPLILSPVYTERPFDADPFDPDDGMRVMLGMRLCTATTAVGVPAAAVPTGVVDGQPLGVQVIGPRHREDVCLAAARELEARFGVLAPVREPVVAEPRR